MNDQVPRNALRHGLHAPPEVVAQGEQPGEWQAHLNAIVASFEVRDPIEYGYAREVATCFWLLNRVSRALHALEVRASHHELRYAVLVDSLRPGLFDLFRHESRLSRRYLAASAALYAYRDAAHARAARERNTRRLIRKTAKLTKRPESKTAAKSRFLTK